MKKWITISALLLCNALTFAQKNIDNYQSHNKISNLWLTDNHFFQYRTLDGIFYNYLRGEWKKDNDQLILTESYYGDISENLYHIRKAPKFDYSIAKRISVFKIDGKNLILTHQEVIPKHAKFLAEIEKNFIHTRDNNYENK